MDNEKKRAKVIDMIDDLYGDNGMAVVNLMTDYMSEKDWDTSMTVWIEMVRSGIMIETKTTTRYGTLLS